MSSESTPTARLEGEAGTGWAGIEKYWPEGIAARLQGYDSEESRRFYRQEKDAAHLHANYVEDVGQLLRLVRMLQSKVKALRNGVA